MSEWLGKYVPLCADAVNANKSVWADSDAAGIDAAQAQSQQRFQGILAELGLELPAGVSL